MTKRASVVKTRRKTARASIAPKGNYAKVDYDEINGVRYIKRGAEFQPHYKFRTKDEAQRGLVARAKEMGASPEAFHVIYGHGLFAIAPMHYQCPMRDIPQFKKNAKVVTIHKPNSTGYITESGVEQSEVMYTSGINEGKRLMTPNVYLREDIKR